VAGIMLVFGVDKFMSECRALTNMIGNSVAAIVVAKWEGQFDLERARRVLSRHEDLAVPLPATSPAAA
jgi:aerobic C4-dicarboxylate transport protein